MWNEVYGLTEIKLILSNIRKGVLKIVFGVYHQSDIDFDKGAILWLIQSADTDIY